MKRRDFLQQLPLAAGSSAALAYWSQVEARLAPDALRPIPRRPYKDGVELSIIGMGAIVLMGQEQAAANREVARAVERGVNYFDVAPAYGKGEAERLLGPALLPFRDQAFLACKTGRRDAAGARAELENSLRVLQTDHFDLYQLHAMTSQEDVDQVLAPGGALETFSAARAEGKVRFLGFSAHNEEVALRLLESFPFDSVLFPINYLCIAQGAFGPRLLARAREKGVARLALKAMAYTPWASKEQKRELNPKCWYQPIQDMDLSERALRFTLSEDITSAIPPGDERIYRAAETFGARFTPLSPGERSTLLESTAGLEPIFRA